ncbi:MULTISPECIES: hypothetical protein [unclassified Serratia (in: enterobacteria)]|uniref:hypothetical protein n=1 Tax=unclassified Serratia (in: enterobacteria) TaxID=2647522 RepID=UPI00050435E6|nr:MULTISPECIES: hypothetical protein [unclassified Serratia (in: enterobacteria)]KFK92771.1 hypothetical protein JV45_19355 [Serratia sp. Ag2]KFK98561.1 hypothetical protein IV04_11935 [Serratia sp. Ag1]
MLTARRVFHHPAGRSFYFWCAGHPVDAILQPRQEKEEIAQRPIDAYKRDNHFEHDAVTPVAEGAFVDTCNPINETGIEPDKGVYWFCASDFNQSGGAF